VPSTPLSLPNGCYDEQSKYMYKKRSQYMLYESKIQQHHTKELSTFNHVSEKIVNHHAPTLEGQTSHKSSQAEPC
jgi:hypothetical protein